MDIIGRKISWKTSLGVCRGTIGNKCFNDYYSVELDKNSKKIMSKLYEYHLITYTPRKPNWIEVDLDDGFYGSPEYEITIEN